MPIVPASSINSAVAQSASTASRPDLKPLHKAAGSPTPEFSVATPPRGAGTILEHHHGDNVRLGYLRARLKAAAFGSCLHWLVGSKDPILPTVEIRAPAGRAEVSRNVPGQGEQLASIDPTSVLVCILATFVGSTQTHSELAHTAQEHNSVCFGFVVGTNTAR